MTRRAALVRVVVPAIASAAAAASGCSSRASPLPAPSATPDAPPSPDIARVEALRRFEEAARASADLAHPPSSETGLGADPWTLRAVEGGYVGILRGRSAVVLLDLDLRERSRLDAPRSPAGLDVAPSGEILVTGELSRSIARYEVRRGTLVRTGTIAVDRVHGLRDIAAGPRAFHAIDERGGRLLTFVGATEVGAADVCAGPSEIRATPRHVVVSCVLDREIVVRRLDPRRIPISNGEVRIRQGGPFWGMDAREVDGALLIAASGVEDHPLDRTQGFFGNVDSFLYVHRVDGGGQARRIAAIDTSEIGIVVPKAVLLEPVTGGVDITVTAYGSAAGARLALRGEALTVAGILDLPPGVRSVLRTPRGLVMANPLLDAWIAHDGARPRIVPIEPKDPAPERVGEALFFTTLIAPWNRADGAHSRFTCETCHFEGHTDGRVHHTGRGDVRVVTKPLLGLFANRPHFSRALDPDLSSVAMNEFRVAGAGNDRDPWFSLGTRDVPWLAHLGAGTEPVSPDALRRAFVSFATRFSHRPNSAVVGRSRFTPTEQEGARVFRDACESCHAARLAADVPGSRVPYDRWEPMIFSDEGPIVWANSERVRTGVVPYVHDEGARTPSLRRLHRKRPYLTNGSAPTLDDVLRAVRVAPAGMSHGGSPAGGVPLREDERAALRAFLDLL